MAGVVLLVLLVLPFIELAVFAVAADQIGFLWCLAAIIVLGLGGAWLIKRQGPGVWRRTEAKMRAGEVPSGELVNGLLLLIAGVLLILPGFVSDFLAIALLIPPVRAVIRAVLFRRFEQRVRVTFAGPVGTSFGSAAGPGARIDTGPATYGSAGVRDVREVEQRGPDAPGRPGPERP